VSWWGSVGRGWLIKVAVIGTRRTDSAGDLGQPVSALRLPAAARDERSSRHTSSPPLFGDPMLAVDLPVLLPASLSFRIPMVGKSLKLATSLSYMLVIERRLLPPNEPAPPEARVWLSFV